MSRTRLLYWPVTFLVQAGQIFHGRIGIRFQLANHGLGNGCLEWEEQCQGKKSGSNGSAVTSHSERLEHVLAKGVECY